MFFPSRHFFCFRPALCFQNSQWEVPGPSSLGAEPTRHHLPQSPHPSPPQQGCPRPVCEG